MRKCSGRALQLLAFLAVSVFPLGIRCFSAPPDQEAPKKVTMRVEAETLASGKWKVHAGPLASDGNFLYGSEDTGPLTASIKLPRAGKYHVWVSVWNMGCGRRRGRVTVNGSVSGVLGGQAHGWKWYNLGVHECDTLDLTLEGLDPAPSDVWYDMFHVTEAEEPPAQVVMGNTQPVWIWSKKESQTGSTVYFRSVFSLAGEPTEGNLHVKAGGPYVLFVNGNKAGEGDNWRDFAEYDVAQHLKAGANLIAISCRQSDGPGGLLLKATIKPVSGKEISLRSSHEFRVSRKEQNGWNRLGFDDSAWWGAREFTENPLRKLTVSEKRLFEELNLDYPGLEKVKAAFEKGDLGSAKQELLKHCRERSQPKYLFDWRKRDEIVRQINDRFPGHYGKVIQAADSVLTHVFTFEGDKRDVGRDVNWFQDSPGGNKSYAQIISRFGFAGPLLQSYWATGDEKYAKEYVYLITDWIADNGRPLLTLNKTYQMRSLYTADLIGWTTLDVGIRSGGWVNAYNYLLASPGVDADFNALLLRSLFEQADYLYDFQLRRGTTAGGNWQVFECKGLLSVAVMFPEFRKAKIWREKAYELLYLNLRKDVHDDGGHRELNSGYQAAVMSGLFDSMLLANSNGIELPPEYLTRFEKMFDYLVAISMPDGSWPLRGDATLQQGSNLLTRGALLYGNGNLKYFSSHPSANDLMLFGSGVFGDYQKIEAKKPSYTSIALPDSKHVIMRTGWDEDDLYLVLDCAPWGGCHSHPDHLNINVYGYGQLLITDSGMPCYDWKVAEEFFRKTAAHNVVMIDDKEQPAKANPNPTVESFVTTANFDFAQSLLENYAGAKQLRSIIFLKPDYWILVDRLEEMNPQAAAANHSIKQLFHFAPTIITTDEKAQTAYTNYARGNILLMPAGAEADKKVKLVEKQGWIGFTRSYMPKAPYIEYQREGTFPMVMPIVLYPYPGKECPPPVTTKLLAVSSDGKPIAATEALCVKVEHEKTGTDYFILSWINGKTLTCEGISFDGQAACLRYNTEGEVTGVFLSDGKKIADKNGIVVESDKVLKKCDVQYRRDTIIVETDTGASLKVRPVGRSKIIVNGKETEIPAGGKVVEIKAQ